MSKTEEPDLLSNITPEEAELIGIMLDHELTPEIRRAAVQRVFEIRAARRRVDASELMWIN